MSAVGATITVGKRYVFGGGGGGASLIMEGMGPYSYIPLPNYTPRAMLLL